MAKVDITIDASGITARPDPVPIPKKAKDEAITWNIATPGWTFTDSGIVIHGNLNQFFGRGASGNKKKFHWTSRNTNTELYKYTINVTNGSTDASCDPGIKNGGR